MKKPRKKRIKLVYGGAKLAEAFVNKNLDPNPELRFTSSRGHAICNSERMSLGKDLTQLPVAQWRGDLLLVWQQCLSLEEHYNEQVRSKVADNVAYAARVGYHNDKYTWRAEDPDYLFRVPLFHFNMSSEHIKDAMLIAARAEYDTLCKGISRRTYMWGLQYKWNYIVGMYNRAAQWAKIHKLTSPSPADIPEDYHGQIAAAVFRIKTAEGGGSSHHRDLDIKPLHPCYSATPTPISIAA
jgi:hypothetical protein